MKPCTIVGSTSSSSCNHSRKRRLASRSDTSNSAVRAPRSRYASASCACVRTTNERTEVSALSTRLRRALNLASHSSARWLARLPFASATLASAYAACASATAWLASLLSSASRRRRSVFSASSAATFFASLRLLLSVADLSRTSSACCAQRFSTSEATSTVRTPDATRSAKSAAWQKYKSDLHTTQTHEPRHNKHRSPVQLTCFSCCVSCCDNC
jgi:hypothetical protein